MEDPAAKRSRLDASCPTAGSPSEVEILTLVSQREACRQRQQFAESDSIRQQLRDLGVEVYDKDRQWKCKDGRVGVLFTAGPYECHMHETEIHARVQDREEARRAKNWERSNVLRDELRAFGVELSDKEGIWRTLQGRQGSFSGGASPAAAAVAAVAPRAVLRGEQIVSFVAERDRYREVKDYESADEVRHQLAQYGVEIFDGERLWKSTDGRQGVIIPGGEELLCTWSDAEVDSRVALREEARSAKNFSKADSIREDLRNNGVDCLDTARIWCTTCGRQGPYPVVRNTTVGHTVGGGPIGGQQLLGQPVGAPLSQQVLGSAPAPAFSFCDASIQALVNAREHYRLAHDWTTADGIRTDLRAHGVEVQDKEKTWHSRDGRRGVVQQAAAP